jgi:hypothetical protein
MISYIKRGTSKGRREKQFNTLTFGGIMSASCLTGDIIFYLLTDIISIESVLGYYHWGTNWRRDW